MIHDVKEYFGLDKEFRNAGYFETDNYRQVFLDLKAAIQAGHLVALTGIVGCGKTTTVRKIRDELNHEGRIVTSMNLAVDKQRVTLSTLIFALFADVVTEKDYKIPTKQEFRERELRDKLKHKRKPVALFVDEAHDLHHKTLVGLKRLIEVVQEANVTFAIVLIGHPKLRVDLSRPTLEEIGSRVTHLTLKGIQGEERPYLEWLLTQCLNADIAPTEVFTEDALAFLAEHLHTPLQMNHYAWKALEAAHQIGKKPVDVATLQTMISYELNSLEAQLQRSGYGGKSLLDALDARPAEIRQFFKGRLSPGRQQELQQEILKLGIIG